MQRSLHPSQRSLHVQKFYEKLPESYTSQPHVQRAVQRSLDIMQRSLHKEKWAVARPKHLKRILTKNLV